MFLDSVSRPDMAHLRTTPLGWSPSQLTPEQSDLYCFLGDHGLTKYFDLFVENDCFPLSVLQHVDDDILKEWGLKSVPRKAIMYAIATIQPTAKTSSSSSSSISAKVVRKKKPKKRQTVSLKNQDTCLGKYESGKDCTSKTIQSNGYCGRHQKQADKSSISKQSTKSKKSTTKYSVGQRCSHSYIGTTGPYYNCTLVSKNKNGTFAVKYDDANHSPPLLCDGDSQMVSVESLQTYRILYNDRARKSCGIKTPIDIVNASSSSSSLSKGKVRDLSKGGPSQKKKKNKQKIRGCDSCGCPGPQSYYNCVLCGKGSVHCEECHYGHQREYYKEQGLNSSGEDPQDCARCGGEGPQSYECEPCGSIHCEECYYGCKREANDDY